MAAFKSLERLRTVSMLSPSPELGPRRSRADIRPKDPKWISGDHGVVDADPGRNPASPRGGRRHGRRSLGTEDLDGVGAARDAAQSFPGRRDALRKDAGGFRI